MFARERVSQSATRFWCSSANLKPLFLQASSNFDFFRRFSKCVLFILQQGLNPEAASSTTKNSPFLSSRRGLKSMELPPLPASNSRPPRQMAMAEAVSRGWDHNGLGGFQTNSMLETRISNEGKLTSKTASLSRPWDWTLKFDIFNGLYAKKIDSLVGMMCKKCTLPY